MSQGGSIESLSKPGKQGVGASLRRNEDARYLDGKGEYLADLQVPGMAEVCFLRSQVAHGKIRSITVPEAARDQVFFASDIAFTKPILAVSAAKGFKPSNYPALTSDKARFVGDLLAICIAPTRAEAEDIAQSCVVDFEELPAIWDIDVALKPDAPRVHDSWSDNVYIETHIATGDLDEVRARADVKVSKSLRMGRHAGVSMEGRGVLAHYDRRLEELVVYSSTQFPHVIRTILADSLGISEISIPKSSRSRRCR
jgi:aerobic carbon-monoxide dehydrogenase large subunit